jgi:hypothetical protein
MHTPFTIQPQLRVVIGARLSVQGYLTADQVVKLLDTVGRGSKGREERDSFRSKSQLKSNNGRRRLEELAASAS